MQDLSGALASAARSIASRIAREGHQTWIVGGAVRDLALGRTPKDVDLASAAHPDEIERWFPQTVPVGKAFGTILIVEAQTPVEHTTFRSESGYSDRRRPDSVQFGASIEEDSARRDFTCNALYLDPLRDECADPQGGLADLARGELRCVGEPRARFAEDGLRLVRLARFAGALDLGPAPGVLEAAREARSALAGVAPERVLAELERIFTRPGHANAFEVLQAAGLLEVLFPDLGEPAARVRRVQALGSCPGLAAGLAALFAGDPREGEGRLESLRTSRETRRLVLDAWSALAELQALDQGARARRIRLERRPGFEIALALARAQGFDATRCTELEEEKRALGPLGLQPEPLVRPSDLEAAGVPRGPRWGELLAAAEEAQLDQRLRSRADVAEWLRRTLAQDGGKT